ncbi:nucleotide excision repair endonuclease [Xanthomonas euvesicatoria pv. citrumelo F1]|nr:nucleotide excision repair endonuclease [Xanthomonas euvesicatoria pv. citrumelo F1]
MGLERPPSGRPCFRAMLKRCVGACSGGEPPDEQEERLRAALIRLELSTWPFHGRIALEEKCENLRQLHVLDAWHYLGTVTTLTAARKLKGEPLGFDRDSYRIIRAAIESGLHAITVLGPSSSSGLPSRARSVVKSWNRCSREASSGSNGLG